MTVETLTDLECSALLPNVINLSDGHARQSLGRESNERVQDVFKEHTSPTHRPDYYRAEQKFLRCLTTHTGQNYKDGQYFVTYSSSVAMGVVATYLMHTGRSVGLICPTFDNIPGILTMMQVPVVPLTEEWVTPACDLDRLDSLNIGALLLVTPNNPTGAFLGRTAMRELLEWSADRGIPVILDLAFRWFSSEMRWDILAEADSMGADVITIDDTGKVLSLADVKVSVISASRRLSDHIRSIHNQYILNVSELALRLLTAMMEPNRSSNEIARAAEIVRANHWRLDSGIESYNRLASLRCPPPGISWMSVQWLRLPGDRARILSECRDRRLEILPGDNFYWSPVSDDCHVYVRIALMRDPGYFARGISIFFDVLRKQI
jgi:aspartate/methionine/tyrosine aminotransferase